MAFNLDQFRNQMIGGGARPNLFEMRLNLPASVSAGRVASTLSPFMVKVASVPASAVSSIDVPYFGRKIKVLGDRTFAPITITVINDENYAIRKALEEWMDRMSGHRVSTSQFRGGNTDGSYTANQEIVQYGRQGDVLRRYSLIGAFPTTLAEMSLDWSTNDSIQEYTCEFAYQWWEVNGQIPTRDNAGGFNVDINLSIG